jgi:hypothetical protein
MYSGFLEGWHHFTLSPIMEPTLRYWYRQMDIQLDSILSTTVSDLRVEKPSTQGPASSSRCWSTPTTAQLSHPDPESLSRCTREHTGSKACLRVACQRLADLAGQRESVRACV